MVNNYEFKIKELKGSKRLTIGFPEGFELLSIFLEFDIQNSPDFAVDAIKKVLSGKSDLERRNFNICGIEINKKTTKIYDNLAEENYDEYLEIETSKLLEIINIWINEQAKFKKLYH